MSRSTATICWVVVLLGLLTTNGLGQRRRMRGAAAGETQEVAQEQGAPQQEAAPPPANAPQGQATLPCVPSQAQNLPISAPPRVVYRDRLLSIDAPGSTLADVLRVIHNKAGIAFEGTTKTTERVAVKISPAPISDALKQLFKDSPFDYMMIARPEGNTVRVWRTSPRSEERRVGKEC